MNIAFLNGVEKKYRSVYFYLPIKVRISLVIFPVLVADGLFMDVLHGASCFKAVGAYLYLSQLKLVVKSEKQKLKKQNYTNIKSPMLQQPKN